MIKVVIITNLGKRQNQQKMLKTQQIFPKLYRCLLYMLFFIILNPEMQGLLMLKEIYIKKKIKGNFCARKSKKISIFIKNVLWSEKTWMHKAEYPRNFFPNSFTYKQAEQIQKGVICVQILLQMHLTEHGRFHFQGRTTFYTAVLVTPTRHMTSK